MPFWIFLWVWYHFWGKMGLAMVKKEPRRVPLLITNDQRQVTTNGSCLRVRVRER